MLKIEPQINKLLSKLPVIVSINCIAIIGIFLLYFKFCSDVNIRSEIRNILVEYRDSVAIPKADLPLIKKSGNKDVVAEQLYSEIFALKAKVKSDELRYRLMFDERIEELNNDVTFWVCVLAAVCTIVPIVLNIAAIYNMNRDYENLKERYSDLKTEIESYNKKINSMKASLTDANKIIKNSNEFFKIQTTLQCIKEMRDFDWQKHHLKSEKNVLLFLLEKIKSNNDTFVTLGDNLEPDEMKMYAITYFQALKGLIYKYETYFDKSPDILSELNEMKYFLIDTTDYCCNTEDKDDLKMKISLLNNFINNLVALFKQEINNLH